MLEGDLRAAVQWLTEHSGGGVMKSSDMTEISLPDSGKTSISVIDALHLKHPNPCIPPDFALLSFTTLPSLEEAEVTSAHVQSVAHHLLGGAGPGVCDASHLCDMLLRYGASSVRLHDTVASLCHRLCKSIVPWNDVRALLASRLIALDKCPGVCPIEIGETLRRLLVRLYLSGCRPSLWF